MLTLYVALAAIFAVAAVLFARDFREPGAVGASRPGAIAVAVLAGMLWPVLAIGLVQWLLIAGFHRHLNAREASPASYEPILTRHAVA